MVAALAAASVLAAPAPLPPRIEAGRSVEGRRIVAVRSGPADAPVRVLVSGSTHGTEPAGHAVIARLRAMAPQDVQVWTVRSFNPDGVARGSRQNAHGVDLNRNLPSKWRGGGRAWDTYYPGPEAASEPETRAEMKLIRRIRPQLTIHYHQHMRLVNLTGANDKRLVRAYARRSGLPARRLPPYHGTASGWQNRTFPQSTAFVVELPAGALSPAAARRHARAVLRTAAGAPRPRPRPRPSRRSSGTRSRSARTANARRAPTRAATTA